MVKILVKGGAGYIGSHTCKVLARRGFEPVVYDNLSRGNRSAAKFGMFELGDIGDAARVRSMLEKYRPSALIHFAAYAYVGESVASPPLLSQQHRRNRLAASDPDRFRTNAGGVLVKLRDLWRARSASDLEGSSTTADQSLRLLEARC